MSEFTAKMIKEARIKAGYVVKYGTGRGTKYSKR